MPDNKNVRVQLELDGAACQFFKTIERVIGELIASEHERLLSIEKRAVREKWSKERRDAEMKSAKTTVKSIADQLPGLNSKGWSVRKLERWLEARGLSTPRELVQKARLEYAKHMLRDSLMPVDEVAYRVCRERRALDKLFRVHEGVTAAEWQGWKSPRRPK